jgi:hypothetical protein
MWTPTLAMRGLSALALTATLLVGLGGSASSHPHVWISVETTVLYDKGAFTGLKHKDGVLCAIRPADPREGQGVRIRRTGPGHLHRLPAGQNRPGKARRRGAQVLQGADRQSET